MRSFLKAFLASFLALVVFAGLCLLILIGIASSVISSAGGTSKVGSKAVLYIDLSKKYAEQSRQNPVATITNNEDADVPGLYDIVRLIKHAETDSAIKGIYIKCNSNGIGYASGEELRNALLSFKRTGKFIIAYGDVISQKAYYVASVADKLYCNPKGAVEWNGMSATLFYVKGSLEKLEIQPQIFYAGKFKSATEPFREYKMTEANRIQTSLYINDLYAGVLAGAAQKSGMDTATLHQLANTGAIQTAGDAVKYKLITAVKYDDEVKDELTRLLKIDAADKINFVSLGKYADNVDLSNSNENKIAVIYAEGEITDGKGQDEQVGSEDFTKIIRKARLDKSIDAIVFRVNSPGGSALASEVIWREITLAKKDKPVVVSFGDVAASGGYYISCNADSIFAQSNTITGSIGVFGIVPNMHDFFKNKLGVTFDGVKTGPFADMGAINRPLNDAERKFFQNSVNTIYSAFKTRVAEGRNKSMAYIDSIAQGRVWTGSRAVALGLVDKLGNIQDAIDCAARMAKLKNYRLKEYPEKRSFLETLFGSYKRGVKTKVIEEEIGSEQYSILQRLKNIKKMIAVPQARLPFDMDIE